MPRLQIGDKVRVKRSALSFVSPKDIELFTRVQTVEYVGEMPLTEDEEHCTVVVQGYSYMISEYDVTKV